MCENVCVNVVQCDEHVWSVSEVVWRCGVTSVCTYCTGYYHSCKIHKSDEQCVIKYENNTKHKVKHSMFRNIKLCLISKKIILMFSGQKVEKIEFFDMEW